MAKHKIGRASIRSYREQIGWEFYPQIEHMSRLCITLDAHQEIMPSPGGIPDGVGSPRRRVGSFCSINVGQFHQFGALRRVYGSEKRCQINPLRRNSLHVLTRNFLRLNRELNRAIREVAALIRESRVRPYFAKIRRRENSDRSRPRDEPPPICRCVSFCYSGLRLSPSPLVGGTREMVFRAKNDPDHQACFIPMDRGPARR